MAIDIQRDRRIGMTCDSADSQHISARGYCLADCGISELMESNLADLGLGKGWSKNPLHEITMSEVSALLRLEYCFAFGSGQAKSLEILFENIQQRKNSNFSRLRSY